MVLEPSTTVFRDMMRKIESTPSYTGGDQGFLNEYYPGLLTAPMFDPTEAPPPGVPLMRLRTGYNGDVGLYILGGNRWMVPESEIGVRTKPSQAKP